ncbi:hypothetical protein IQ268_03685 [Oculatella sp. LEGE 06141]|uniref:hypothetical protein n=1 Tax=Oculatella sp. LEGE 06141 TaxID=1828648 RepID=UPI00187E90A2|nr:hypothetical protein [Oculatella sp. LEGE 06141]MBE9177680.1 hypothetical protein [Oculatella sp. LEGE 06141]
MVQALDFTADLASPFENGAELTFQLPDPEDEQISDQEFDHQVETAWQVCDRFDLQTDIWRGRILRAVRDREKRGGDGRGTGFLNWLKDREISKSQAYSLIELANSADTLLQDGMLEPEDVNHFSKRAFVETAQSAPEVQQMVSDAARRGDRITRREVRQMSDEWTAMSSDLLPIEIKEKAANSTIPTRYLAPCAREMAKLPEIHQTPLRAEIAENPDVDTLKQVTAEARYLAKYLNSAIQVQALNNESLDIESALEEALRIGCLSSTADLVNQAAQLEQTIAKLYTTWKRLTNLAERVYLDSGASTPHLRTMLSCLNSLSGETLEMHLGDPAGGGFSRTIRLKILNDAELPLEEES